MKDESEVMRGLLRCEHNRLDRKHKPHSCPYQSEIHGNERDYCTCCAACEHECLMDT